MFVNHFIFLVNIKPNSFKHIIYKNKLSKLSNKTIIDRTVLLTYEKYFNNPKKEDVPTLKTFYSNLVEQPEPEDVSDLEDLLADEDNKDFDTSNFEL